MRSFSFKTLLTLALLLGTTQPALALLYPRIHGSLGAWNGSFQQSDAYGHETHVRTLTSLGLEFGAGINVFNLAFIEYNFAWMISNHTLSPRLDLTSTNTPSNREGPYFAPLGFNVGAILPIPIIKIEPYVGVERGSFGFTSGATRFSGLAGKLGINVRHDGLGVRVEYRRHYLSSDDAGSFPVGMSGRFDCWYVGLAFGAF